MVTGRHWTVVVLASSLLLVLVSLEGSNCQAGTTFETKNEDFRVQGTPSSQLRERFGASIDVADEYSWTASGAYNITTLFVVGNPHTSGGGSVTVYRLEVTITEVNNATTNETSIVVTENWIKAKTFAGSDTVRGDAFGQTVSISKDGKIIAVGAPSAEAVVENPNYDLNGGKAIPQYQLGAVYIFNETVPGSGNWIQRSVIDLTTFFAQAHYVGDYMDLFGSQVKLNEAGDMVMISANPYNSTKRGVYIFSYSTGSNSWVWTGVQLTNNLIVPPGWGTKGPRFATTANFEWVVLRTNNATPTNVSSAEQITIFQKTSDSPLQYAVVDTHNHVENDARERWFGWDIQIDITDNSFLVGAPLFDGDVSHYTMTGASTWTLTDSFSVPSAAKSYFGTAMAFRNTTRGKFVAIGAPIQDSSEKGSVYLYQYNVTSGEWIELYKLTSTVVQFNQLTSPLTIANGTVISSASGDLFGGALAMSDGYVFVGAEMEGAAYIFKLPDLPPPPPPPSSEPELPPTDKKPSETKKGRGLQLIYILIIAAVVGGVLLIAGIVAGTVAYRKIRKDKLLKLAAKYREMNGVGADGSTVPPSTEPAAEN